MKKTRMAAATAMALTVAMGMSAFAAEADLPSADLHSSLRISKK